MKRFCKRGQFNFVWLFAILAGGAILALAIWGALQAGDTIRYQSDTEAAMSISILTNPLQSGFAEGSFGMISFQSLSRINNVCSDFEFGKNDISVAASSGVGREWNDAGGAVPVHDKYIFSEEAAEGEDFYVFSKSFDFPYEISDLIFLFSDSYCFLNSPDFVEDDVLGLGIDNIALDNCTDEDIRVCFGGGSNCDVIVYGSCSDCDSAFDEGVVSKAEGDFVYVGSLMYGAIFSGKDVYDCNVERLFYRAGSIARIFSEKADLMSTRSCDTGLKGDLISWEGLLENATSDDLVSLKGYSDSMNKQNAREVCGMW